MSEVTVIPPQPTSLVTIDEYVDAIARNWFASVESIFRTARLVVEADSHFTSVKQQQDFRGKLAAHGIGDATLSKLRQIGNSNNFKIDQYAHLPASYNSLYLLARMETAQYNRVYNKLAAGKDFDEVTKGRRIKASNKDRLRTLFSLYADPDKLTDDDVSKIERFVESFNRRTVIKIRRSPTYNKLFAADE